MDLKKIKPSNFVIENVQPTVNAGQYPVKREPGDKVEVTADLFRHGHEKYSAAVVYRKKGTRKWNRSPMRLIDNDQWSGFFTVEDLGIYEFTVEAWTIEPKDKPSQYPQVFEVRVDPIYARHSTWYEIFPRSQGTDPNASATWKDCQNRLDDIQSMGFDTLYLTPIHPIGKTNRKGPNNTLKASPTDPGCPYAIGSDEGGHYSLEPQLGSEEDFDTFMRDCKKRGLEMVLDVALNSSPDHPHVEEHPEWFYHEADGSIKFAENPPKKYEDIYPYDYFNENYKALWTDIRDMILYWAEKGFTIFRIDNPHTKPFQFWEWCIGSIKEQRPEVVFLAEAFTRPKMMHRLAKAGFDQSYTYFTWRDEKWELEEYFTEMTQSGAEEYMRGILFATTPDIHPKALHNAPREAFMVRYFLSATLSSLTGLYSGYELCENVPRDGKEELIDSEKYQFKVRDWNSPGNIKDFVALTNHIKTSNVACHEYDNLKFHKCENDQIMVYSKRDETTDNTVIFVVNLDYKNSQQGPVTLDLEAIGKSYGSRFRVKDLMDGQEYEWNEHNYVVLDPKDKVAHALVILED